MAAPTFVDDEEDPGGGGASGTSVVFEWGDVTGEADNDVALFAIYKESTAAYTATPAGAGWAQAVGAPWTQDTGGFKYLADLWWRRRAGDTGAATWSWSGATWRYAVGAVYRGVVTGETPLLSPTADEETSQNAEPVHPGITVARTDSGLVWVVFNFTGTTTTTAPAGFTRRGPSTSMEVHAYDDLTVSAGATGTVTGDLADPEYALSVLLELATEAGGAPAATSRPVFPRVLRVWRGTMVR